MSKKMEKEFRESLGIKDNIVYHYCSLDSLLGIVTSKSLWLTSLQSTNDKKELTVSKRILDNILQEAINSQENSKLKLYLEKILNTPQDKEYKKFHQSIKYFGLSCVSQKDSLTHWDRYGSHGTGVCIGINLAILDNYFDVCLYGNKFRTWLTHERIVYSKKEQEELIMNLLYSKINSFGELAVLENLPHIYSIIYYSILDYITPLFKDEGFRDENEYRIVFQEKQGEDEAKYYKKISNQMGEKSELFKNLSNNMFKVLEELNLLCINKKYAKISDIIRGYYALNLEPVWSDTLIPEVVIGPKCFQNKQELKGFFKSNGLYRTDIEISKIPMR